MHKHPDVNAWLAEHSRVHMHFTPASASWVNLIERPFAEIKDKPIRRGVFKNARELEAAISAYIEAHNEHPRPYTWPASVASILEKVERARRTLAPVQALERAQGYLRLPDGKAVRGVGHEHKCHGTTTLLAALNVLTGTVRGCTVNGADERSSWRS